jgi:hypothetical protein
MKAIIKKLAEAKNKIKGASTKKAGRNTYSNYDYFLPEQIEQMVHDVCKEVGLLTTFQLIRNEVGITGLLTIYDLEGSDTLELQMATAIPEIKATNTAQQLGGCMTYTERYLKMSAFGITENGLDFDGHDNTKTQAPSQATKSEPEAWLNITNKAGEITPQWRNVLQGISSGIIKTVADVRAVYKVNKEVAAEIERLLP